MTHKPQKPDEDAYWFILAVPPQKEFVVGNYLKKLGHTVYVPYRLTWAHQNRFDRARGKPRKSVKRTVIPRYVFIRDPSMGPGWYLPSWGVTRDGSEIRQTRKPFGHSLVRGILGIGDKPIILTRKDMNKIAGFGEGQLSETREQRRMRRGHQFKVGDKVRVAEGPFEGWVVNVDSLDNRFAHSFIDFAGQVTRIKMPVETLEHAG